MLDKKVIVVTGGAGLLGKSFIEAISTNGGIAIIADFDEALMGKAKTELLEKNPQSEIDTVFMNIVDKNSITDAIKYLDNKYGKIDAVVNNAYPRNKSFGNSFFDVELDDFNENINMNLGGYFLTSQQFALYFKDQGYGNIINIASIYGIVAPNFDFYDKTNMIGVPIEYPAIKSALIHLTKYMAKYFKGLNIKVNAISPGGIFDNQHQLFLTKYNNKCISKGMLGKEDLQGTLLYLLSDMSQFVNGQNIVVDDGFVL